MQSLSGLYAYEVGCRSDGGYCDPVWTDPTAYAAYTSPTVANGMLFVAVGLGELRAYDVAQCAAQGGLCSPVWKANLGFESYSSPAVANGVVYIGGSDGYMYAYKTHCATVGGTCSPLWKGYPGTPTTSSPAVANGVIFVSTQGRYQAGGRLLAYNAYCTNARHLSAVRSGAPPSWAPWSTRRPPCPTAWSLWLRTTACSTRSACHPPPCDSRLPPGRGEPPAFAGRAAHSLVSSRLADLCRRAEARCQISKTRSTA
jgi:hypothetical protein